jgi:hypothetical protein
VIKQLAESGYLRVDHPRVLFLLVLTIVTFLGFGWVSCARDAAQPRADFDGEKAYEWVVTQCEMGYRITGTETNIQAGDTFSSTLRALDWSVREQQFEYKGTMVRNLLAWKGNGPGVLVGAHYDTRREADEDPVHPTQPVLGANDGASGVAVLLELARTLNVQATNRTVYLAFFDAEDNGYLDGWDWIVGSSYMATHWGERGERSLEAVVVVDMVGDRDQNIYYDRNSNPDLSQTLWDIAIDHGYDKRFIPQYRYTILDDHVPFARIGVPAVDIIDFDYPYWHTTEDTPDKVSAASLEAVGRAVETWLENLGQ